MRRTAALGLMAAWAGLVAFANEAPAQSRERGGDPVTVAQYPWHVAIEIKVGGATQHCSGALVRPDGIVTAARCLHGSKDKGYQLAKASDVRVKHGVTRYQTDGRWLPVERVGIAPGYAPDQDGGESAPDVALLKLAKPVYGRSKAIPAAEKSLVVPNGQMLEMTGWGGGQSLVLRMAKLPSLDFDACNAPDANNGLLKKGMMCAGHPKDKGHAFRGDGGAPVVWRTKKGAVLIGVLSPCCGRPLNGLSNGIVYMPTSWWWNDSWGNNNDSWGDGWWNVPGEGGSNN